MAILARADFAEMIEYRAFTLGEDDHITASRAVTCSNDGDAIIWAKQLIDGHDIELWHGDRFVIRLMRHAK
jgi:hypothetical protein